MADKYGVDPYICLALAKVESSKGKEEWRFGKIGKRYYGPYGIHQCFMDKWNVADPYINTEVGIRALALHIRNHGNLKAALHKYNVEPAGFDGYYKSIIQTAKRYKNENVFGDKIKGRSHGKD